jgi:hypothetical protein
MGCAETPPAFTETAIPFGKSPKAMAATANEMDVRSKGKEEGASLGAPSPKLN